MKPSDKVILAPNGIPWASVMAWIAVVACTMVVGTQVLHSQNLGSTFTIGGLLGNGAFAAMLGRG